MQDSASVAVAEGNVVDADIRGAVWESAVSGAAAQEVMPASYYDDIRRIYRV